MDLVILRGKPKNKGVIKMEEKALFSPIKYLLEDKGFIVKGEINDIDILALKMI